jgi:quercetin 2,3-dioxygenase
MMELRQADARGVADFGWLNSHHTFSFGRYYDAQQVGFSDLLVINDDIVQAGMGFGTHPHNNMEIFSYVLQGALAHKDSMGTGSVINVGDLQMMSAGTGISHSEFNHSKLEKVHFLQIWIVPNQKNVKPRYQQQHFSDIEKRGKLRLIISPDGEQGSLSVYQDLRAYAGLFNHDESAELKLATNRYAYVHIARGSIDLNGTRLSAGDGVKVRDEQTLLFANGNNAEVLVFDLRPIGLPEM